MELTKLHGQTIKNTKFCVYSSNCHQRLKYIAKSSRRIHTEKYMYFKHADKVDCCK